MSYKNGVLPEIFLWERRSYAFPLQYIPGLRNDRDNGEDFTDTTNYKSIRNFQKGLKVLKNVFLYL